MIISKVDTHSSSVRLVKAANSMGFEQSLLRTRVMSRQHRDPVMGEAECIGTTDYHY